MILDATAGNRTMWYFKEPEGVIFIDRTTELERKPTIFCSNEKTPFMDKTFDTIFYDPPHTWGNKTDFHSYPRRTEEYTKKWKDKAIPRYYGWDIYNSRSELTSHIYRAGREFHRILKDDGLLWVKWNEMSIDMYRILMVLDAFLLLLRVYVGSPTQTRGKKQTYWLCMNKKLTGDWQTLLF